MLQRSPEPENYQSMADRNCHLPRLEKGVASFDRFQVSRLVRGGQFQMDNPGMSAHFLCVPQAAGAHLVYRQERLRQEGWLQPGQITLLPAGRPAFWIVEAPPVVNTINIALDPTLLAESAGRTSLQLVSRAWFSDPQIERLATALADQISSACPDGTLFLEHLLGSLALRLARRYSEAAPRETDLKPGRAEVQRVLSSLNADLTADHSLGTLAAATCLSPYHLAYLFKSETGMSIHACLVRLRVERAADMLRYTKISAGEIAVLCGFYDQSHLARHFKRLRSVSLTEFRRSARTGRP